MVLFYIISGGGTHRYQLIIPLTSLHALFLPTNPAPGSFQHHSEAAGAHLVSHTCPPVPGELEGVPERLVSGSRTQRHTHIPRLRELAILGKKSEQEVCNLAHLLKTAKDSSNAGKDIRNTLGKNSIHIRYFVTTPPDYF